MQPGKMFLVDTAQGRIIRDEEIKKQLAEEAPYGEWIRTASCTSPTCPIVSCSRHSTRRWCCISASSVTRPKSSRCSWRRWPRPAAKRSVRWAPTRRSRCCPNGRACCSTTSRSCSHRSRTRRSTPSAKRWSRRWHARSAASRTCCRPGPTRASRSCCPRRSCRTKTSPRSSTSTRRAVSMASSRSRSTVSTTWRAAATACAIALDDIRTKVSRGDRRRRQRHRAVATVTRTPRPAPIPSLLLTSAVHHHLIREKSRTRVALVVEAGDAREVHHMALLIGFGAAAINPYLAFETIEDMIANGELIGVTPQKAIYNYIKALHQGRAEGDVEDGHLDGRVLHRRAGLRSGRPGRGLRRRVLHRHHLQARRHRPRRDRSRSRAAAPLRGLRPADRAGRTATCGSAANTSGAARASTTCSTPTPCSSCSTRRGRVATTCSSSTRQAVDNQATRLATLRGLFKFKDGEREPVPIEEVQPVSEIVKRFSTGAMSYGSISAKKRTRRWRSR